MINYGIELYHEEHMDYSKIITKKDVGLETFKKFLANENIIFDDCFIDSNEITEPTDIRYNNINYQITEGDKG